MAGGEFAAIERLRRSLGYAVPGGETWIGDDAAVLAPLGGGEVLLLATDAVVESVHADLALVGLDDFGWKALASALSDVAAMGGRPGHCLVTVAGPANTDLDTLFAGLGAAATHWDCPIVGGDLVNAPTLVVSVTVTGTVPAGRRAVLRSGACPGDSILVTGPLGGSAAGLRQLRACALRPPDRAGPSDRADRADPSDRADRAGPSDRADRAGPPDPALVMAYRRPMARIAEGLAAAAGGAKAMIDISDGLAADLTHVASASGVGFVLDHVPVAGGASLEDALGGGEDYELVFAAGELGPVFDEFARAGLTAPEVIGWCSAKPSERRLGDEEVGGLGWEHDWS